jgi:hypothetical protein
MAVLTKIKTNASYEEIKNAINCYNYDISCKEENIFEVYIASYDIYHLSIETANDILKTNLLYYKKDLKFEIIKTEYE